MIYLQDSRQYRKHLQGNSPTLSKSSSGGSGRYQQWWKKLSRRVLPQQRAMRPIFLRTLRYRMWVIVLESLLRTRMRAGEIGLCTVWSPYQCRLLWRMALLLPIFVARNSALGKH